MSERDRKTEKDRERERALITYAKLLVFILLTKEQSIFLIFIKLLRKRRLFHYVLSLESLIKKVFDYYLVENNIYTLHVITL